MEPTLKLTLLLLTILTTLLLTSIKRALHRRTLTLTHACKPIPKSYTTPYLLGLDKVPSTIQARKDHTLLSLNLTLFRTLGNTFTVTELSRRVIVTIEPENIKTVLLHNFKDYGLAHRLEAFRPLLGEGIFDTDGAHWAASRALIRPSFNRSQVADLSAFEDLVRDLLGLLPRDGGSVDLLELFFCYSIDSATGFLFGNSVGTLKMRRRMLEGGSVKEDGEIDFAEAFRYAQLAVLKRGMLGPLNVLFGDRKADECNRICRDFVKGYVEEAYRAVEAKQNDEKEQQQEEDEVPPKRQKHIISHELASRTSDKHRVLDELMNVLLAGRDTTASLMGNLFFMLAKNPAIWNKLRREVSVLEGRIPTYEELRSLKYVQCCINESLRLHPVVPRNERQALKDTILPLGGGPDGLSPVLVPKGHLVAYNLYAMHRRHDIYGPDADEFRPERWEDGTLQPRWGYLPFNGGPRICIGQRYALTEVGYVLVRMAQEFRVLESRDEGPWVEELALTLSSRNGARVGLVAA